MGELSTIAWTHSTFNPWIGCSKVSAGCASCYAEADMAIRRKRVVWGPNGTRSKTSEAYWKQPLKWHRDAECTCGAAGFGGTECAFCAGGCVRPRVFCASLADVFEDWGGQLTDHIGCTLWECGRCGKVIQGAGPGIQAFPPTCGHCGKTSPLTLDMVRRRLFTLISNTSNLDWLLLTKRPENVPRMVPPEWMAGTWPANVWLGTSVENQATADERIPHLLRCPAPVRFLSSEPLLGPILLTLAGRRQNGSCESIHWVIVGGESGTKSRPCRPEWIRSIVDQSKAANVPVFVKQMGANVVTRNDMVEDSFNNGESGWPDPDVECDIHGYREDYQGADCRIRLRDSKGGDISEWPEDLRVREFPVVS